MVYCEGIGNPSACLKCNKKDCVLEDSIEYMRDWEKWDKHYNQTHSPEFIDREEHAMYGDIRHIYEIDMFYEGETDELIDALKEYQNQEIYYKRLISAIEKNTTVSTKTYKSDPNPEFEKLLKKFKDECGQT